VLPLQYFSKDHFTGVSPRTTHSFTGVLVGALDPKLSKDHSFTGVLVGVLAGALNPKPVGALNPKLSKDHSFTGVLVGALNP
jgi:hypothetical protein